MVINYTYKIKMRIFTSARIKIFYKIVTVLSNLAISWINRLFNISTSNDWE